MVPALVVLASLGHAAGATAARFARRLLAIIDETMVTAVAGVLGL